MNYVTKRMWNIPTVNVSLRGLNLPPPSLAVRGHINKTIKVHMLICPFTLHIYPKISFLLIWIKAPDKAPFSNQKVLIFSYFFTKKNNICCGNSLEAPQQGLLRCFQWVPTTYVFLWRNKKNSLAVLLPMSSQNICFCEKIRKIALLRCFQWVPTTYVFVKK